MSEVETYDGAPCARGHTLRYRSNRKCVACAQRPRPRYFALTIDGRMIASSERIELLRHIEGAQIWKARLVE